MGDPGILSRLRAYLRTVMAYAGVFSWSQLALFKLSDILTGWVNGPLMRRARALRLFAYSVPPGTLEIVDGEYRFRYSLNGSDLDLALRVRSSDVDVFLQVLKNGEYEDVVRMLGTRNPRPKIIDAGANIGLATLYFKSFLPEARILALEPEPENYRRLSRCLSMNGIENATLLNRGLWTHDALLAPDRTFRDGQAWSFSLKEGFSGYGDGIPVMGFDSLMEEVGWSEVDLMKIDIEGGEAELMRDPSFLNALRTRVGILCMEVHEEVIPRSEVQRILSSIGMTSIKGNETLVAWDPTRFRATPPQAPASG